MDLVTCTVEILDGKLYYSCSVTNLLVSTYAAALKINTISSSTPLMSSTKKYKMLVAINSIMKQLHEREEELFYQELGSYCRLRIQN